MSPPFFMDSQFEIYCEWGEHGLQLLAPISDVIIIVDVMSFTTCVEIAVSCGASVYPVDDDLARIESLREKVDGMVAAKRSSTKPSLSPRSLVSIPAGTRLILPSINGARLSAMSTGVPTIAGCLRNCCAVARAAQRMGKRIAVIPAGERWKEDGSIRFAIEDYLGTGAIIHHLDGKKSPEALAAETAFTAQRETLAEILHNCTSGRELVNMGFADDISLIQQLDVSESVPVLMEGCYCA